MTTIIPEAALSHHIGILGKTGSGKTYTAKVVVEGLLKAGKRVAIIDPTGAWWGLKSSADGKKAGYEIAVFGGDHADVPIAAGAGAALGELIATGNVPAIVDTSAMTVGERGRLFTDLAGAIFRKNKSPLHLVIDEAHMFAPQGKVPDPQAGLMLHAANQLASAGRSRGIRLILITQRPAKLHKDSLTQAETLIAMRLIAPQDREAVKEWIDGCGDAKAGKEVLDSLASLTKGEGWVWYPDGGFLERVKFPRITTFDSSRTPEDGEQLPAPRTLAEVDLAGINAALQAANAEAEASDPRMLRARVAELEKQLAAKGPAVDPGELARAQKTAANWEQEAERVRVECLEAQAKLSRISAVLAGLTLDVEAPRPLKHAQPESTNVPYIGTSARPDRPSRPVSSSPASQASRPTGNVEQRILDAIAWWSPLGIEQPTRTQVAFAAGYAPSTKSFKNALGALRSAGRVDYPGDSLINLTPEGAKLAAPAPTSLNMGALRIRVFNILDGEKQREIFNALHNAPGMRLTRDGLAAAVGYSPTTKAFKNNLGAMRSLGVIEYPGEGLVQLAEVLR
jgi:hypothetical protein